MENQEPAVKMHYTPSEIRGAAQRYCNDAWPGYPGACSYRCDISLYCNERRKIFGRPDLREHRLDDITPVLKRKGYLT